MSDLTPPPLFNGGKPVPAGRGVFNTPKTGARVAGGQPLPPNLFHNKTDGNPQGNGSDSSGDGNSNAGYHVEPAVSKEPVVPVVEGVPHVVADTSGPVAKPLLEDTVERERFKEGVPSKEELRAERAAEFDSFLQPVDPVKGGKKPAGGKKPSMLTWVLLGVLVVAGAGAGYYFFLM